MSNFKNNSNAHLGCPVTMLVGAVFFVTQISVAIIGWWLLSKLGAEAAANTAAQSVVSLGGWLIAAMLFVTAVGITSVYMVFYYRVTNPLRTAVHIAKEIADGRLASPIDPTHCGEVRPLIEALADMQEKLARIIGETRDMAWQVVASSEQLAKGAAALSSRTEEQAATLEQTAASTEEFAATIRQTADNTQLATLSAREAINNAREGRDVVSQATKRMDDIRASAQKITEITNIIDAIAFQTNTLAINAAIEAARAGEHGRGFAVVAAEVRSLAKNSAASAKEIKRLIETTVGSVKAGSALVLQADGVMQNMVKSSESLLATVSAISVAARAGDWHRTNQPRRHPT